MQRALRRGAFWLLVAVIPLVLPARADDFPPGPGQALVARVCTQCHEAAQVTIQRRSSAQWTQTV